jgi:uncharacterized membrane protein
MTQLPLPSDLAAEFADENDASSERLPANKRQSLFLTFMLLLVIAGVYGSAVFTGLNKLHLEQYQILLVIMAIVVGSAINFPVKRIVREQPVWSHPMQIWGLDRTLPRWTRRRRETILAVNLGGCLVPLFLSLYQLGYLVPMGPDVVWGLVLSSIFTTLVCYLAATPVHGVGILMPGYISPAAAAGSALLLVPDAAPAAALFAGTIGPLVGADFLHIFKLVKSPQGIGMASIGGAGTFDGIVISAILAAMLA